MEYYISVGPGIMRALRNRPTTLERWPDGVIPGVELTQRTGPPKEAFFQKRIPKGRCARWVPTARITFPSGRYADEVCPDKVAVVAGGPRTSRLSRSTRGLFARLMWDHPDELRIDLDPQPGTDFPTPCGSLGWHTNSSMSLDTAVSQNSAAAGSTFIFELS